MPETKKVKKVAKKANVRLVGAKNSMLVITLDRSNPAKLLTYATHITIGANDKKKRTRGATEKHANEAAAAAAVKKLHSSAVKLGWTVRVKSASQKPDAFDATHLPKA